MINGITTERNMNQEHLNKICTLLNLGEPISVAEKVIGGLLHEIWKVKTTRGIYAIKKINLAEPLDAKTRQHYETTEQVAKIFQRHGVATSISITHNERSLIDIDNDSYLVFPWIEAQTLASNIISAAHALKIAQLVAKMHSLQLQMPGMPDPGFEVHTNDSIKDLVKKSNDQELPFAIQLNENLSSLLTINEKYQESIPLLCKTLIVGHRDLDQKNVLWDKNDDPIVIDWESAALLNPTQEIITAALDWSWKSTTIDTAVFDAMINTYQESGAQIDSSIIRAAFYGVLGNMLNWLLYNIKRSQDTNVSDEENKMGVEQVNKTMHTMHYLYTQLDQLSNRVGILLKH